MLGSGLLGRILPDRLSHWLVALVVGGILLTQALALSLYHADRMRALEAAQSRQAAECVAGFAQMLKAESPAHRRMMMRRRLAERRAMHLHRLADQGAHLLSQLVVCRIDVDASRLLDLIVFVVAIEASRLGERQEIGLLLEIVGRRREHR